MKQVFYSGRRFLNRILGIFQNHKLCTHIARKTFATTVILGNGANIGVVSKLLGHADVRITLDAYGTFHDQLMLSDVGMIREKLVDDDA